nr:choice-of-anchor P family protein [Kibdelosporangium sp. MJ126-NF4]CEL15310.1 hypothetical protein [Kibdelosporangium sp. MJ126-NF4]
MRSTIVRRTFATAGVMAIGLAIGASPALAAEGTANSKAELVNGNVFGQTIVSPLKKEFPPGGTDNPQNIVVPGVVRVEVKAASTSATGNQALGQSQARVNTGDTKTEIGIPNVGQLVVTNNTLDSKCSAEGGVLTGSTFLAGARIRLLGPGGIPLMDIPIPVNPAPNTGYALPNGLGEVVFNKIDRSKPGVISATAISISVLGNGAEVAKTVCGPNIPTPQVPAIDPAVGGASAGLALAGLAGFGLLRNRRRKAEIRSEA